MFVSLADRALSSCGSGVGVLSAMSGDGALTVHVVTGTGLPSGDTASSTTGNSLPNLKLKESLHKKISLYIGRQFLS